ncbi:iron complex outermembrane recepter protein [Thalassolituus maritimus]|uniref:Iron complex outermembrane recepter protein n=1 Tax=Thalassolituus maritimus TaxID=484498 RepID=A0A1N7KR50_9GAMM|nr:TonB-dependent receptor [Thalassolituus maritimus]SIS63890.1 iron complex outermembrane recepter protein [Thalassolituus maritimus]
MRSLSAATLIVLAGTSQAEDVSLDDMVVSGSRAEERVASMPASVNILDQKAIEEGLKVSPEIQQLLSVQVPGFSPSKASTSNSGFKLRGRNALILIDGVPQSTPLRNGALGLRTIDAAAIERIEVIKGSSSLYGHGASGGLVNYITKQADPDSEFSGDVGISTRFSAVEFEDSLSKRIDSTVSGTLGQFSYLVSGAYDSYGEQKDSDGDTMGLVYGLSDLTTQNLLTKLGWEFDDQQRIHLTYNYFDSQQDTNLIDEPGSYATGEKTIAVDNDTGEARPGDPQGPNDNYNLMVKYSHDEVLPGTSFSIDAYKQRIENVFFFSTRLANPDEGYDGGQSVILSEKQGLRTDLSSVFSFGDFDNRITYGVDYVEDVSSQPLVDGRIWVPEMDMDNTAAYVQNNLNWNDNWMFKAGIRQQRTEIQVDDYDTLRLCRSEDTCSEAFAVEGGTLKYNLTTYNLGVRYTAMPEFSPFFNYSEGYDISDLGRLLRSATVTSLSQVETEASKVKHYEIGASSDVNNLHLEVAIYRSTSTLGTSTVEDPNTGIYLPVREPQEIYGVEILADYQFNSGLLLGATYSHIRGENPDTNDPLSNRFISPDKLTAYVNWPVSYNVTVNADITHIGERDEFDAQEDGTYSNYEGPISGYQVANARVTYQPGDWQVYAGVENLFNEDYFPVASQSLTTNASYYTEGPGRTIVLGSRLQF